MRFEWVKWKRNPKNILLVCLLLAALFIHIANQWDRNTQADEKSFTEIKAIADEIQPPQGYTGPREAYKLLHHSDEAGEFYSSEDKEQFKRVRDILYLLEDENTARNSAELDSYLQIQTERLLLQQEYIDKGGSEWVNVSSEQIERQLSRNHWLSKRRGTIAVDLDTTPQGAYVVLSLVKKSMTAGLIVLIIGLFFFDFLTSEYEQKTYLLMAVQPLQRWQRYARKLLTACGITVLSIGLYLMIGFIVSSLLFGTGSFDYPILVEQGQGFTYISLGSYLAGTLFLQLLFSVFSVQLLLLLSYWLRNSLEVLGAFLVCLLLPNFLLGFLPNSGWFTVWLPFLYMNSDSYLLFGNGFLDGLFTGGVVLTGGNLLLLKLSEWAVNRR